MRQVSSKPLWPTWEWVHALELCGLNFLPVLIAETRIYILHGIMIQDLIALTMYLCKGLSVCMSSLIHVSLVSLIWCVADAEIITGLEGSGPIFLDRLDCTLDDTSLLDCHSFSVYSLGLPQCDHSQDVSIRCRGKYLSGASTPSGLGISNQVIL